MAILFFRTLIIFTMLLVLMRLLGKRQMGELELSELVVSVLVADLAAMPIQDIGIPLMNGIVPVLILFSCELIVSGLTVKSVRLRAVLCGRPCMLIRNGKIRQDDMRRCRFTVDELAEELRGQGITDISTVQYAILETDGTLSAVLFPENQPATPQQLGVKVSGPGYPFIVIDEGRVMSRNLELCGKNEAWLRRELSRRGVSGPERVYLMIVYDGGEIYFAEMEDKK